MDYPTLPYPFFLVHFWLKKALQIKSPHRWRQDIKHYHWRNGQRGCKEKILRKSWLNLSSQSLVSFPKAGNLLSPFMCLLGCACMCMVEHVCVSHGLVFVGIRVVYVHVWYMIYVFCVCVCIYVIRMYLYMSVCTFLWRLCCVCRGWSVHIYVYVHVSNIYICGYGCACVHMCMLYVGVVGWMFTGVCLRVVCVCVCACVIHMVCLWRPKDSLWESVLSYNVASTDGIKVTWLDGKFLSLLSCLSTSRHRETQSGFETHYIEMFGWSQTLNPSPLVSIVWDYINSSLPISPHFPTHPSTRNWNQCLLHDRQVHFHCSTLPAF